MRGLFHGLLRRPGQGILVARKILDVQKPAVAEHQSLLDALAQLAHVARPALLRKIAHDARRYARKGNAIALAERLGEALHQGRNVLHALAQRRHLQHYAAEPVEQVQPEAPAVDQRAQVAVRGGHDAEVDAPAFRRAQALHLPVFQHAQQLDLDLHRYVGHFIEEQRAALGLLQLAGLALFPAAGEGACLVAEQF